MTALALKNPSWLFKTAVVLSQGTFVTMFWIAYMISPRFCHRFVGYLEEEAVKTYTHCLQVGVHTWFVQIFSCCCCVVT